MRAGADLAERLPAEPPSNGSQAGREDRFSDLPPLAYTFRVSCVVAGSYTVGAGLAKLGLSDIQATPAQHEPNSCGKRRLLPRGKTVGPLAARLMSLLIGVELDVPWTDAGCLRRSVSPWAAARRGKEVSISEFGLARSVGAEKSDGFTARDGTGRCRERLGPDRKTW